MVAIALSATLLLACGCTQFDLNKNIPWGDGDDVPAGTPTKVVAVWTDTVLYRTGREPVRGFGGRLMFYAGEKEKPIQVDGSLVVYAFDEEGRDEADTRPDRKYVFTPEQLPKHYSRSDIGHSYSVWIPWDTAGKEQKEIALIVRFTPRHGPAVVSEQTTQLLPGDETEALRAQRSRQPAEAVKPVSHEENADGAARAVEPASAEAPTPRRMQTTTIGVPVEAGGATLRGADPPRRLPDRADVRAKPEEAAADRHASRPAHFVRGRSRPLGEPIAPPRGDPTLTRPRPAIWQSDLEPPPPAETPAGGPESAPAPAGWNR